MDVRAVERELAQRWPHRSVQIRALAALLTACPTVTPPILVEGPSGTGKTGIVWCASSPPAASCVGQGLTGSLRSELLRALDRRFCRVTRADCVGSASLLWTFIVAALLGKASNTAALARVEDVGDAVPHIRSACLASPSASAGRLACCCASRCRASSAHVPTPLTYTPPQSSARRRRTRPALCWMRYAQVRVRRRSRRCCGCRSCCACR